MTFKRYKSLVDVWAITPPMAHLMAAWVGYKPQEKTKESEEEQYQNLLADFAAAGGKTN